MALNSNVTRMLTPRDRADMASRLSLQFAEDASMDGGAGAAGMGSHFSHGHTLASSARPFGAPFADGEGDEDEDLQRALALSLAVA